MAFEFAEFCRKTLCQSRRCQDLGCESERLGEPRATASDRLVAVAITVRPNREFASVVYRTANGAAYDRGKQYEMTNGQNSNGLDLDFAHRPNTGGQPVSVQLASAPYSIAS